MFGWVKALSPVSYTHLTQLKKGREEDPKEELEKGLQEGFETGRKEEC